MEVLAHLSPSLLGNARLVLADTCTVVPVSGWAAMEDALRHRHFDAILVDPQVGGGHGTSNIIALRRGHPSVPIVVYTVLAPGTMRSIAELGRHGVEHVLLYCFDDEPGRFRDLVERLPAYALGNRLLEQLSEPLARVPTSVARAIERCFRMPHRFHRAEDLAAASGITLRQLYRILGAAGLTSPRLLTQGARLLRAYAYLQDPGCTLQYAAERLGYSAPRVLSGQMNEATGMRPTQVRRSIAPDAFVARLVRRLYPEGNGRRP